MGPRRRLALLLLILPVLVLGCSTDDEAEPEPERVPDDDPGLAIEIRVKSPPEREDPSGRHSDPNVKYDLRVTLQTSVTSLDIGTPLPVRVIVSNAGEKPQTFYELKRSLDDAIGITVRPPQWSAKKPLRFGTRRKDGGPKKAEDFVCLAPGESMEATLDLAPLLALMETSPPGAYQIALVFESSYKGEPFGIRSWNEMGYKRVPSNVVTVELRWPEWKARMGVTVEFERQIEDILDAIGPDGRLDPAFRDLLAEMGPTAIVVLEEKIGGCTDSNFARCLLGWNAFYALAALRREALPILATSRNAGRRVNLFLNDVIAEIETPGEGSEVAHVLAKLRTPAKGASPYAAQLTKHEAKGRSRTITVHADGRVILLEPVGDGYLSRTAFLEPEGVTGVFSTLHDNAFWIQQPMRTSGSKKESLLSFALLEGEEPLHTAEVWETEAVAGNRQLAQIHAAFRKIERAAREVLARKSLETSKGK